jgi:hypothetical protein
MYISIVHAIVVQSKKGYCNVQHLQEHWDWGVSPAIVVLVEEKGKEVEEKFCGV